MHRSDIYKYPWADLDGLRQAINDRHPRAMALLWIEAYADNLSSDASAYDEDYGDTHVTTDELINTALGNINNTGERWCNDYIVKGPLLEGVYVDSMFWEKLAEYIGEEIPDDKQENFFSCSC